MRTYLLLLLVAVSAVLLWAMWSHSYVNTLVFSLGLLATGLCGYLIGDYFFNLEKKTWQSDLDLHKKEAAALNEEVDILRKQASLTAPQAEIDGLKSRNAVLEAEKNKINGEFLAQAGNIASLNTRLEALQREYSRVKEDAAISSESRSTELEAIRDTLTSAKAKITELGTENETLKREIERYKSEVENQQQAVTLHRTIISNQVDVQEEMAIAPEEAVAMEHNSIVYNTIAVETPSVPDDLTTVVGIDDHIQGILQKQGISTWRALADTHVDNLRDILQNSGMAYQLNDPLSWPQQAHLLANGETENFKNYIAHLHVKKAEETPKTVPNTEGVAKSKRVPLFFNYEKQKKAEEQPQPPVIAAEDNEEEDNSPQVEASSASDIEQPNVAIAITEATSSIEAPKEPTIVTVQAIAHPIYGTSDDLKAVEGIGPKIELLLKEAGIMNWNDLAEATPENLRGVLEKAGTRYRLNDPTSWPEQARLLANAEWDKFKEYTEYLIGGRTPKA
jgi:predicted flap endonuclease-1-like 5' DNA nuclease